VFGLQNFPVVTSIYYVDVNKSQHVKSYKKLYYTYLFFILHIEFHFLMCGLHDVFVEFIMKETQPDSAHLLL
jgi:hypothetical protein